MMLVFIVKPPLLNNNKTFNLKSLPLSPNNNTKFLIWKKDEYRTGRDRDGRVIILPSTTADEHIAVISRDIWNAIKLGLVEMRIQEDEKSPMLKQEYSEFFQNSEVEGLTQRIWYCKLRCSTRRRSDVTSDFKSTYCQENAGQREEIQAEIFLISRYRRLEIRKKIPKPFFLKITVDTLVDWTDHDGQSDGVIASKEFGMIAGCDTEDAIEEGAAKIYNLITGADTEGSHTAVMLEIFSLIVSAFLLGRPLFNMFAKADSMKVVPPPLSGDYTPLSDHIDLDESQMSYGTKSSTSGNSNSVSNDFVSCDNRDKSSEVNTNDFASSDSSVKSSDPSQMILPHVHLLPVYPHLRVKLRLSPMYYNHMQYGGVRWATAVKPSAGCSWKTHRKGLYWENPYSDAEDEGIFDSGCSRSMTGNMERLDDFQEFQGGKVTFGGGEGRITGKGTIRTPTLDFENVYYVKELQHFNLFSISQICDKKNRVLFTDTDCLVLSKDFMLPDESMVLLRVPRKHNLYTINLNNLSPKGNLACLMAKASVDESVQWHRRMGHVNYKNMNRLVKGNLVRGLPPKLFKNDHTCVACCKGKQHKASYKAITAVSSISEPLQLLHMDLFGPTSIRSIDHKYYCLVITDDYSRFCWVFFLEHKDETYSILKDFINLVENQLNKKVKAIRCDNSTEFKNAHIIELCGSKGIKRDYSNARTPQQNGTKAVRTACYVLNRVLVTSPHNKTPYALLTGNIPSVSHFKPFGCHVTILNTSDHLGKFDGKADEGYIVGYSANNKAYRVYNVPNKRVEETMNLRYLEEKPNVQGLGHEWYFDLDYLTDTLGGTHKDLPNPAGTQEADSDSKCDEQVIIIPSYPSHSIQVAEPKDISSNEVDDSPLDSAEEIFQKEIARLKSQEQRATFVAKDTKELQKRAS
ncbi:putative ribonuclease H-like domain-containing protein, partial [Tanacetum coccineum]